MSYSIKQIIGISDVFASFEVLTLNDTIFASAIPVPSIVLEDSITYIQDEMPEHPGFNERGDYIITDDLTETGDFAYDVVDELGLITMYFPSHVDRTGFQIIDNSKSFRELIKFKSVDGFSHSNL